MLLPREPAFLQNLNSYYIDVAKFTEHLQGDLGSGSIYCDGAGKELLIYFDEHEIIKGLVQYKGEPARGTKQLQPILSELQHYNFRIQVNFLDQNAVYFWAQMPPFQRANKKLSASSITLPDLIFRLKDKSFSGFIDISLVKEKSSALLFFHEGQRIGGSYSWGYGGLDTANTSYNQLVSMAQHQESIFALGNFLDKEQIAELEKQTASTRKDAGNDQFFSQLDTALNEYLALYSNLLRKKSKNDPIVLLRQQFIDHLNEWPFLDPFSGSYEFSNNKIRFGEDAPRMDLAKAIIQCAHEVVEQHMVGKKFRAALSKWSFREVLEEHGIPVGVVK